MDIPKNLKFTKEHEWIRPDSDLSCSMGITDYAASQLGDITFIELPHAGKDIKRSDIVSSIESVKAASDIYAPLGGKIAEVNTALEDAPELINSSPYTDGWICKIDCNAPQELGELMSPEEYGEYIEGLEK